MSQLRGVVLPVERWPEHDRLAWEGARKPGGRLNPGGPAAGLAAASQDMMEAAYGTYLAWLKKRGALVETAGPEERVTFEHLAVFLEGRRLATSDMTVFSQLRTLKMFLNCVAPRQDWAWLARHPSGPMRHEAMIARRRPLTVNPGQLLHALCLEMDSLMSQAPTKAHDVQFRDDLLVASAVLLGLRRRNLLEMRIGHHLIPTGKGWRVDFEGYEIKNRNPIGTPWPRSLEPYLRHYLDILRPRLAGSATDVGQHLFIGSGGGPVAQATIGFIFERVWLRTIGQRLHPHMVRYTMATTIMSTRPTDIQVAAAALGHSGTRTTEVFYDQSGSASAQRIWQDLVAQVKRRH